LNFAVGAPESNIYEVLEVYETAIAAFNQVGCLLLEQVRLSVSDIRFRVGGAYQTPGALGGFSSDFNEERVVASMAKHLSEHIR